MAEPKKKKEIKATRRAKIWAESVTDDMIRWFLKHEDDIETVEDIRRDSERGIIECSVTTYWHDDETDEDFPITDEARFTPHKAVLGDYEKADALSDSWELYLFALGVHELQLMDNPFSRDKKFRDHFMTR